MTIACVRCGRVDATLRVTYFRWVVSVLLLSYKRPAGGILCSRCRWITNASCTAITALAGWWGLPWGFIWTPQALFVNLRGGERPVAANALLLGALSVQLRSGDDSLAGMAAYEAAAQLDSERARAAAAQATDAASAIGTMKGRTSKRADVLRFGGAALVLAIIASAVASSSTGGQASGGSNNDLVFEGSPAEYVAGTVKLSGRVRNTTQRLATAVWLEVIVTDAATGKEVARAKKPDSAPNSAVTIQPQQSVPFDVSFALPSNAPKEIKVGRVVHWRWV